MKATKTWVLILLLIIPAINVHAWPIPDTSDRTMEFSIGAYKDGGVWVSGSSFEVAPHAMKVDTLKSFFGGTPPSLLMSPLIWTTANATFQATLFVGSDMEGFAFQNYTSRDSILPIFSYEENFESFSGLSTEGWISPMGVTGTIRIVSDPTGSGRNNLLELQDTITAKSDIGAVVYSPVIDTLKTANLTTI